MVNTILHRAMLALLVGGLVLYIIYFTHPVLLALRPTFNRFTPAPKAKWSSLERTQSEPSQQSLTTHTPEAKPSSSPHPRTTRIPSPDESKEPLYLGDSYAVSDAPQLTRCSHGIRQKVKLTGFRSRFLHQIPVLQWYKDATLEEYERLRRYPGAHGWGGVDYDTLKAALSVLNTTASQLMFDDWDRRSNGSSCIRCAVVGNGGILRGSGMGREIDQHHYVFRTNGAVIKGFEEDVGCRTSLYTFSTNTMKNSIRAYAWAGFKGPPISEDSEVTKYIFLPDHDRDYLLLRAAAMHIPVERGPERSKTPPSYFGNNVMAKNFRMYHPDFIRYLRNRFLHSRLLSSTYRDIYRPSTGAIMLLAALHTCDQVSAYGFMTPDYAKYSDHYYDTHYRRVAFYANHDLRMEMALWQELHKAGLIRLYMRT